MKELNENQYKILSFLSEYAEEYYFPYKQIVEDTKLSLETIKKEVQELKKVGLVEYARGLMNEEGEVAGSGFTATGDYYKYLEQYRNAE